MHCTKTGRTAIDLPEFSAMGLAITFGVLGIINMAHAGLIMLGAWRTVF